MKIVIAIDSFKGSLTSMAAGNAAANGIHRVWPDAQVEVCPLADGGEGTVEALTTGMGGVLERVMVTGPLGTPVEAVYGYIMSTKTAVIEMAAAAGITLVPLEKRNPLYTTTYGVGELILDAIQKGCRHFLVGIGGSATNDGGLGMLQALGVRFLDQEGEAVSFGAIGLKDIARIDLSQMNPLLQECTFKVACDVTNPLRGPKGCSAVFAPQKGATPQMVMEMDDWFGNYVNQTTQVLPSADEHASGAGAAGGLGFAFLTYLNARLESGIQIVLQETHLEDKIAEADYIITGEGRLDGQSIMGKAPIGVAELAKKYHKPVLAFAGSVSEDAGICNAYGIDAFFPIIRRVTNLEEAMQPQNASKNMEEAVEQVFRAISITK